MIVDTFVQSREEYIDRLKQLVREEIEEDKTGADEDEDEPINLYDEEEEALGSASTVGDVICIMTKMVWDVETVMTYLVQMIGPMRGDDFDNMPEAWEFDT